MDIRSLAYTLQVGREEMSVRLAFVVQSVKELYKKLDDFYRGQSNNDNWFIHDLRQDASPQVGLMEGEEKEEFIRTIIDKRKFKKLAYCWTLGVEIDWELLYTKDFPVRMPLPSYTFENENCWAPNNDENFVVHQ